jgi:hypothetical protein
LGVVYKVEFLYDSERQKRLLLNSDEPTGYSIQLDTGEVIDLEITDDQFFSLVGPPSPPEIGQVFYRIDWVFKDGGNETTYTWRFEYKNDEHDIQ